MFWTYLTPNIHTRIYDQIQEGKTVFYDRSGNPFFFRPDYHEYIDWTFPGHNQNRPKEKGCGFIRSKDGGSYTACVSTAIRSSD